MKNNLSNVISKIWLMFPGYYNIAQEIFNGNFWIVFANKFKYLNDTNFVDLACGTGAMLDHIRPKKYLGLDVNSTYINYARKKYGGSNIQFKIADISNYKYESKHQTILFIGAIHHMSDIQLKSLLLNISKSKYNRFIIVDGVPKGKISKILEMLDAVLGGGKYFRTKSELRKLLAPYFKSISSRDFKVKKSHYSYLCFICQPY